MGAQVRWLLLIGRGVIVLHLLSWRHKSGRIGEDSRLSLINVANGIMPTFRPRRVVIDESRVDGSEFSVGLDLHTLAAEDHSALSLGCLEIDVFWVMDDLSE